MPTPEIYENTIYKDQELADLFDIPIQNIRELFKKGHIKGTKIGKRWLVSGKALLELFDASERKNATEEYKQTIEEQA